VAGTAVAAERMRKFRVVTRWSLVLLWYAVLFMTMAYGVYIWLHPPETSSSVEAVTEYMRFTATDPRELNWNVGGFELEGCLRQDGIPEHIKLDEGAGILIGAGVTVSITKREGSAETHIELVNPSASSLTANGVCTKRGGVWIVGTNMAEKPVYGSRINLTYRPHTESADPGFPAARVFPFRGVVTLGKDPGSGAEELLLSGHLSLHASYQYEDTASLISRLDRRLSYIPETLELQWGDVVLPPPAPPHSTSEARGFVRLSTSSALQLGYYVRARQIQVQRAGNASITLNLTFWDRAKNEPALSGAITALVALFGAGKLAEDLGRPWHFVRRGSSAKESTC
jgi:hypothetical protein